VTDIKAVVRVEHPEIVLTETVAHDRSSKVRSVSEGGNAPGDWLWSGRSTEGVASELGADHPGDERAMGSPESAIPAPPQFRPGATTEQGSRADRSAETVGTREAGPPDSARLPPTGGGPEPDRTR
jgi:hypothetical protein